MSILNSGNGQTRLRFASALALSTFVSSATAQVAVYEAQTLPVTVVGGFARSAIHGDLLATFSRGGWSDLFHPMLQLFRRTPEGWSLHRQFENPAVIASSSETIGASLAFTGRSIVTGYPTADSTTGIVLRYEHDVAAGDWVEQRIVSPFGVGSRFGSAVAESNGILAVGALSAPVSGVPGVGVVAVYERTTATGSWALRQVLEPQSARITTVPGFGSSYAFGDGVQFDSGRLYVRAVQSGVGAIHVFEADPDGIYEQVQIIFEPIVGDGRRFGESFDVQGDLLVAGMLRSTLLDGRALLYRRDGTGRFVREQIFSSPVPPVGNNADDFGTTVAIDGREIYVGDSAASTQAAGEPSGAVFVYTPDSSGTYGTTPSRVLRGSSALEDGLGRRSLSIEGGFVAAVAGFSSTPGIPAYAIYALGPEREFCAASPSPAAPTLGTFYDQDANGGRFPGLILSQAASGTRYLMLGSYAQDSSGASTILGAPGLCLSGALRRLPFGRVGGNAGIALYAWDDLPAGAQMLLDGTSTVFLQALFATPSTPIGLTRAIELEPFAIGG